jgi:predicted NAD-dependent protein-ADP-ribosyltransferase YbiA (DUF1768 family)
MIVVCENIRVSKVNAHKPPSNSIKYAELPLTDTPIAKIAIHKKVPVNKSQQVEDLPITMAKIPIKKKPVTEIAKVEQIAQNKIENSQINFYDPKDPYGEFSNFYGIDKDKSFKLVIDGQPWRSTEHYYQSQKFRGNQASQASLKYADYVAQTNTAGKSAMLARQNLKKMGQYGKNMVFLPKPHPPILIKDLIEQSLKEGVTIRPDWEQVKDDVMLKALAEKFVQNPKLAQLLLSTGQRTLVEHTTRDSYWGDGGDGSGKNMLGKLLMKIRSSLT